MREFKSNDWKLPSDFLCYLENLNRDSNPHNCPHLKVTSDEISVWRKGLRDHYRIPYPKKSLLCSKRAQDGFREITCKFYNPRIVGSNLVFTCDLIPSGSVVKKEYVLELGKSDSRGQ